MERTSKYYAIPNNMFVFSIEDIMHVLMSYLNFNPQHRETVQQLMEVFESYENIKKGMTYEVVLKGEELLEEILQAHRESSARDSDVESHVRSDPQASG